MPFSTQASVLTGGVPAPTVIIGVITWDAPRDSVPGFPTSIEVVTATGEHRFIFSPGHTSGGGQQPQANAKKQRVSGYNGYNGVTFKDPSQPTGQPPPDVLRDIDQAPRPGVTAPVMSPGSTASAAAAAPVIAGPQPPAAGRELGESGSRKQREISAALRGDGPAP